MLFAIFHYFFCFIFVLCLLFSFSFICVSFFCCFSIFQLTDKFYNFQRKKKHFLTQYKLIDVVYLFLPKFYEDEIWYLTPVLKLFPLLIENWINQNMPIYFCFLVYFCHLSFFVTFAMSIYF
jgi:hypothetical protein